MRVKIWIPAVLATASALAAACQSPLDASRTVDPYASFGDAIYREACQRVAYTGQLAQREAGEIATVDVSGSLGRGVCVAGEDPPAGAPPKLRAIADQREELTRTVDAILPDPFLDTLEAYLVQILPLHDDGTLEDAIASLGQFLAILHDDPDVPAALARLALRDGYRPPGPDLVRAVVEYPELHELTGSLLGLIAPGGAAETEWRALLAAGAASLGATRAVADPGSPERTLALALKLLFSHHPELATGVARPVVARDLRGVARVSLEDGAVIAPFRDADLDRLADTDGDGRYVDAAGQPLVAPTPFPEPGVADAAPRDALGRALAEAGGSTPLYQYLELDGTVLAAATVEARELIARASDPAHDAVLGLVQGASGLLGPRAPRTRTYADAQGAPIGSLAYTGFDTAQGPVLDLLHAFVQVLGGPDAELVLQATETLLSAHESPTARVIDAMLDAADRRDLHPAAQTPATGTVHDEMAPLIARVLRVPGLAEDLVRALQDPHVRGVAPMLARQMTAANPIDFNHTNAPIGAARGAPDYDVLATFDPLQPVDRTQPDADDNRSVMQRISHLIHDANGARFCNKEGAVALGRTFAQCALFRIDDLALFYALNIASDAVRMDASRRATTYNKASFREQMTDTAMRNLITDAPLGDTVLQGMIRITGFTRFPSPRALNRALFLRPTDSGASQFLKDTTDPVPCTDGDLFIDVHDRSIAAWELPLPGNPSGFADDSFYDAVRPLVDAFARHDECVQRDATGACTQQQNAVKIFIDLLAMLHEHWGSPQSSYAGHTFQSQDRSQPRFAFPDNLVSFEPLIAEVLEGDLVPGVLALAPTLDALTVDGTPGGVRALPPLVAMLRYVFDPEVAPAGLAYRDGSTSTVQADGVTPVPRATPFYLLADAFARKREVLAALSTTPEGAAQAAAWEAATSELVDRVLTVEHTGGAWRFQNRRLHGVTQVLLRFLRGRLVAHTAAGDREPWVRTQLTADLTDTLGGPGFAALADLTARLVRDPAARGQLYGLLGYLLDETAHPEVARAVLATAADRLQLFLDDRDLVPVQRALGAALDPAGGVADAQIALIRRSHDLDTERALLTILRNLYRPADGGDRAGVTPAADLADVLAELNRAEPGHGGDLDAADVRSLLGALRDFFVDDQRGLPRFLAIVRRRGPD